MNDAVLASVFSLNNMNTPIDKNWPAYSLLSIISNNKGSTLIIPNPNRKLGKVLNPENMYALLNHFGLPTKKEENSAESAEESNFVDFPDKHGSIRRWK